MVAALTFHAFLSLKYRKWGPWKKIGTLILKRSPWGLGSPNGDPRGSSVVVWCKCDSCVPDNCPPSLLRMVATTLLSWSVSSRPSIFLVKAPWVWTWQRGRWVACRSWGSLRASAWRGRSRGGQWGRRDDTQGWWHSKGSPKAEGTRQKPLLRNQFGALVYFWTPGSHDLCSGAPKSFQEPPALVYLWSLWITYFMSRCPQEFPAFGLLKALLQKAQISRS